MSLNVELKSHKGKVTLQGLSGQIILISHGGVIELENMNGEVELIGSRG